MGDISNVDYLKNDLETRIFESLRSGQHNYIATYVLMIVSVCSSIAAAICAIFLSQDSKLVAALALIPGVLSVAATTLKLQGKAN